MTRLPGHVVALNSVLLRIRAHMQHLQPAELVYRVCTNSSQVRRKEQRCGEWWIKRGSTEAARDLLSCICLTPLSSVGEKLNKVLRPQGKHAPFHPEDSFCPMSALSLSCWRMGFCYEYSNHIDSLPKEDAMEGSCIAKETWHLNLQIM